MAGVLGGAVGRYLLPGIALMITVSLILWIWGLVVRRRKIGAFNEFRRARSRGKNKHGGNWDGAGGNALSMDGRSFGEFRRKRGI